MNFELIEADPKPTDERPKAIFVAGKRVGEVEPCHGCGSRWHASISLFGCELIQGFANSPELAVAAAIVKGRKTRDEFIRKMAELEALLGSEGVSSELMLAARKAGA